MSRRSWEVPQSDKGVLADVPYASQDTYAAPDLTRMPARDLLTLPLLLEDEREVAEESVWKVIAPKGVAVLVQPEDEAAALGRLRGMQMVEVELAVGPWLKLKKTAGWVRAQGGTRGMPSACHTHSSPPRMHCPRRCCRESGEPRNGRAQPSSVGGEPTRVRRLCLGMGCGGSRAGGGAQQ